MNLTSIPKSFATYFTFDNELSIILKALNINEFIKLNI